MMRSQSLNMSEEEEYRCSLPSDIVPYANENAETFIPDKDVREAIRLQLPKPDNLYPLKKLDDFLVELLK